MTDDAPVIVITGGPHGGKTELLKYLKRRFKKLGYAVVIVPEAATQLINAGQAPWDVGMVEFQRLVLALSIKLEEAAKKRLRKVKGKKVIFADRGVMDGVAYVDPGVMESIWEEFGYNIVELRDGRYAGVIHMESTAVSLPHLFSCENNPARYEKSVEEAAMKDRRTRDAWIGTPHFGYVNNSTDFPGKIERAYTWARYFLGEEEHERKYRLLVPFSRSLLPDHAQCINIRQSYIRMAGRGRNQRIRARGQQGYHIYTQTLKSDSVFMSCMEQEISISEKVFAHAHGTKRIMDHEEIFKDRWCFVGGNDFYFELDVFRDWPDDVLMEVEVPDPAWLVELPASLVGKVEEVTGDPNYTNKAISKKIRARKLELLENGH